MFNLTQTFNNPTPQANDSFGNSVAISGNNALIGASNDNTGATAAGSAYLFDITTGNLLQTFNNPTPESLDQFGSSVAISGNNALIGALKDNTGTTGAGSAYLFDITTGNLLQTFNNPTPQINDNFGISVAISGNNALIGAWELVGANLLNYTAATTAGSAYLFDITTGNLLQAFNNPTPQVNDAFGESVAISGNNALIGAENDNTGATSAGSAYLFDITTGNLLQTFNNPTPQVNDSFGLSVAISGNNALIGAYNDNTGATGAGSAYLFDITTGNLLQTFNNPTPQVNEYFGQFVAISGNNALIGVFDNTGATLAGSAYLFDVTTGNLLQTFNNPTPESNDGFSYSLAISGNNALIGTIYDNTGATGAGSAYLYAMPAPAVQDVPGPLPLFGAGAAFGWSRQLRRRIGRNRNALA